MGNSASFDAVRRFQKIREATNEIGHVGDDVSALVKVGAAYQVITGIVVRYRSDAGRIVLSENGTEYSLSSSDVRKYVEVTEETPAHEDFLAVSHFRELKDAQEGPSIYTIGESVAVLLSNTNTCSVVYGKVYGTAYNSQTGIKYMVVTREGTRHVGNDPDSLARI